MVSIECMLNSSVLIASDHRGFALKTQLIAWLKEHGTAAQDLGTNSAERCDALDFAKKMAAEFKSNPIQFGVLICGSGQAMAMTANRFKHLRATLCSDTVMAKTVREHNDANVLVLGADFTGPDDAVKILESFLTTKFLGGRYGERNDRLAELGGLE